MPIQTKTPGTSTVVSRAASPGGGWNAGSPVAAIQTVNNVYLSAVPFTGSLGNYSSGQSDFLVATNFGFAFTGTDTLVSISVAITYSLIAGVFTNGTLWSYGFDTVQAYNGGLIGSPSSGGSWAQNQQPVTDALTTVTLTATPTIAQINSASFGIAIGAAGVATNAAINITPPTVEIDMVQVTVQTTPMGGGGGGGIPPFQTNWNILPGIGVLPNMNLRIK